MPEARSTKNRVHLDVQAEDRHAEVERLVSLGGELIGDHPDSELTVMRDPEGNEFCVIN